MAFQLQRDLVFVLGIFYSRKAPSIVSEWQSDTSMRSSWSAHSKWGHC